MATHQDLADFIKKVHIDLRLSCRREGAETAWQNHCQNNELLKKYAAAMQQLATSFWEKNNAEDPNLNRIYWVVRECDSFYRGGQLKAIEKEKKLYQKYFGVDLKEMSGDVGVPLKMLDVGSCYNPFKKFDMFDVTAIDIAPATEDVVECDFVDATVDDSGFLRFRSYDVVLFSFFLEYLPDPEMRYDCCRKAYDVLKPGGVLVILTPDSKHDSANAKIIKLWRCGLANIGFLRTNYQKLKHLRCMTFYKCLNPQTAARWLTGQKITHPIEKSIVIPQDLNPYEELLVDEQPLEERSESDNNSLVQSFANLAGTDVYYDL